MCAGGVCCVVLVAHYDIVVGSEFGIACVTVCSFRLMVKGWVFGNGFSCDVVGNGRFIEVDLWNGDMTKALCSALFGYCLC